MTDQPRRTGLFWSTGKDSAWALFKLRADPRYEVSLLVSTVNDKFDRVTMHAVRSELLEAQAQAVRVPLRKLALPWPCRNRIYEQILSSLLSTLSLEGFQALAFGDLALEDVRAYREGLTKGKEIRALFPLWGLDTGDLAKEMIASGLKARVTCVDPEQLSPDFIGRDFDEDFLKDLPQSVDPCGENGEFHTFCWDGPMFESPVPIETGEVVERDGFVFCDLRLVEGEQAKEGSPS